MCRATPAPFQTVAGSDAAARFWLGQMRCSLLTYDEFCLAEKDRPRLGVRSKWPPQRLPGKQECSGIWVRYGCSGKSFSYSDGKRSTMTPQRMNPFVRSIFSASCIALVFDASTFGQLAEPASKAPPSATQQAAMIAEIRQKGLDYRRTLPDLLCTQTAHRYSGATQKNADQEETWKLNDTLTINLSYFEQKDHHQLVKVNGRPAPQSIDNVGGHLRAGDFGSNPASVFAPGSRASLHWERWAVLNGRVAAVLSFAIDLDHTPFSSTVQRDGRSVRMKWACKGLVYADTQTPGVLRIAIESLDLHDADWTGRSQVHDYAYQEMGGREFLLPVESVDCWTMPTDPRSKSIRSSPATGPSRQ